VLSGNSGTAINADAPSLIALAKQMELGFDALLRAPDAPPLDHIDAITISPYADEAYEQQACAAIESMDGQSMRYTSRICLKKFIYVAEMAWLFSAWPRLSGYDSFGLSVGTLL
jgi:hypothetical protein